MTGIRRKNRIFHLSYEQRNAVRGYWFILPWLIGFLVFYAGCLVQLGEFSLSRIGLDAATGMTKEYIGFGNYIAADKIVSILSPDSAPIKRMIADGRERGLLVDASFGRSTRAVILMNSNHMILSALTPEDLAQKIKTEMENGGSHTE